MAYYQVGSLPQKDLARLLFSRIMAAAAGSEILGCGNGYEIYFRE